MREFNLKKAENSDFDVLVVGGGINGASVCAALSASGLRVVLVEKGDFGSFTSQVSSNLIWGGIKYLETMSFFLVRKLCKSRNLLMKKLHSQVKEIRFFSPHRKNFKHGLLKLYLGTWFYWFIGSFFTRRPKIFSRNTILKEEPIVNIDGIDGGFEYSDAMLPYNDARFVFNFIKRSIDFNACVLNYAEAGKSNLINGIWETNINDLISKKTFIIKSKAIINAGGPFLDSINEINKIKTVHKHILSKGAHVVVDKLAEKNRVLTFFAEDERMFFVIPMGIRSNIGTTDTLVEDPNVKMEDNDRNFILKNINKALKLEKPLTINDIISERCGVRPLAVKRKNAGKYKNFLRVSRKHVIETDYKKNYISIFGGKLTDCLNIGEKVFKIVQKMKFKVPAKPCNWYAEPENYNKETFINSFNKLSIIGNNNDLACHLWERYFERAYEFIGMIEKNPEYLEPIINGSQYIWAEWFYSKKYEFVLYSEDFLRRRTNLSMIYRKKELENAFKEKNIFL